MKTTIDIPEKMMREAMKYAKSTTKRDAVLAAIEEFNRRHGQASLIKYLGTFKNFMTNEDLARSRAARTKRHGSRR